MNGSRDNLAPLMFAGMILFMLIGYPAAFSLAATGLFFGFLGIEFGLIRPDFLGNLTYQLFGIISNDLLLAIPFFTFMGAILERCGLAEDLLDSIGQLFGPVRGGLSYAVIFVGAILGAITGTVAASVIAMGVISMTPMLKYGYSIATYHGRHRGVRHDHAAHSAVACPRRAGRPAGALRWRHVCWRDRAEHHSGCSVLRLGIDRQHCLAGGRAGASEGGAHTCMAGQLWKRCMRGMIPSLGLIFLVLGTIFMGLATPTEAGAMGVVGALALAVVLRHPDLAAALPGHGLDDAPHRHGGLYPDRRARLQPGVPGRRRQSVDRGPADLTAGRSGRLS